MVILLSLELSSIRVPVPGCLKISARRVCNAMIDRNANCVGAAGIAVLALGAGLGGYKRQHPNVSLI